MLELDRVAVSFGGLRALDAVSLSVSTNEIVGLVGPNGAGKTTLFNVISGTVKPGGGSVRFRGDDLRGVSSYRRARLGLGRTFQIPQPMHELTVRENLRVAQRFGAGQVDTAEIDRVLHLMHLDGKADVDAATQLSLSELKALEVAKALATRPQLLLLDEVLAGLEARSKRTFTALLREVHAHYKLAIIIIEHDIETISSFCPRVAVLNFGRVIADGSPDAVFDDPAVRQSYTGVEDGIAP
jgi:branched-chain amino acid transport system ATP-binding protein